MPIYEYKCDACQKSCELVQKVSDPVATACPHCHADTLKKQITAAAFHLKGKGWYATDFKNQKAPEPAQESKESAAPDVKKDTAD